MPAERPDDPERCADVVLLVGPSGCGKTYLARQLDLPVLALDNFYRGADDPAIPRNAEDRPDWEDPGSWDADAAVAALGRLCCETSVTVPDYSLSESRPVGTVVVDRQGSPVVIAEGIFAGEIIGRLRDEGLLADALLIRQNRWLTFARRLVRDIREGRKEVPYLVRQGWAKLRAEPGIVARQQAQGARPVTKAEARARLRELAAPDREIVGRVGIEPTTQGL